MNWHQGKHPARVVTRAMESDCLPAQLLGGLDRQEDPVVLDSSALHATYGRYTILACRPLAVMTLRAGQLTDRQGRLLADDNRSLWSALRSGFESVPVTSRPPDAAYVPGWIGYLGYELGRHIERLPGRAVRDTHLDDLRLAFYDSLLVYDACDRTWSLTSLVFDSPVPPGAGQAAGILCDLLADAGGRWTGPAESAPAPTDQADATARPLAQAEPNFSTRQYQHAIRQCVDYIAAGDIFQVNLSQRLTVRGVRDPLAVYGSLRQRNPAWYAAYLRFQAEETPCWILSSSPELFLRVRGDHVTTRPIKGTRPRTGIAEVDLAAARELSHCPKDRAELTMIIDLLRNDLGRVCRYGSVRVTDARALETHPTVFHLVGTVEGRLCEGVGPAELIRATFPGGSITGAPKIRAMEIIDELEPVARGVYTGCIGIVCADGNCEWNIAIRTMVCENDCAWIQVGGGIVADSTPVGEYDETLDKARALLEAVAQVQDPAAAQRAAHR